jgi:hypothetical protein
MMQEQTDESQLCLLDVLSNPYIAELVLGNISRRGPVRLACKALRGQVIVLDHLASHLLLSHSNRYRHLCSQVDRQVTSLRANIQHVDHVKLAKQLARKQFGPPLCPWIGKPRMMQPLSMEWHLLMERFSHFCKM